MSLNSNLFQDITNDTEGTTLTMVDIIDRSSIEYETISLIILPKR